MVAYILAIILILSSTKADAHDELQELDVKMYKNIKTRQIIVSGFVSKITDGDTIVIEDFFKGKLGCMGLMRRKKGRNVKTKKAKNMPAGWMLRLN